MERPKYRYYLGFQCTKNGHLRRNMTYYVNASSYAEAKQLVKEIFPDAKTFRIIGKWDNKPKPEYLTKQSATPKAAEPPKAENTYSGPYSNVYEDLLYTTWKKRKAYMESLQKEQKTKYTKELSKLTGTYEARCKQLNKELDQTGKKLEEKYDYLRNLCFFSLKRRKMRNWKLQI